MDAFNWVLTGFLVYSTCNYFAKSCGWKPIVTEAEFVVHFILMNAFLGWHLARVTA